MWVDKILYWAWVEDRKPKKDGKLPPLPHTPTKKRLIYAQIHLPSGPMMLAVTVYDDDKPTEVHRDELKCLDPDHPLVAK